jgi:membrane protein DedA with SNARE-associated domain
MNPVNAIQAFFAPILAGYPFFVYFGTYLSVIIFGNVVSFATLWLAFQGNVQVGPFLGVASLVILADISGDQAWYWLGRSLRDTKFGSFLYSHIPRRVHIEKHIEEHPDRWIFLSKFIPYSTFPIIFMTGWAQVPFRKFLPASLAAIISSVSALVLLAYGFKLGLSALQPVAFFKSFERLFLLGILLFLLLHFLGAKLSRRAFHRREPEE